jgi:hypothetical protein
MRALRGVVRGWMIAVGAALVAISPRGWCDESGADLPGVTPYRPSVSTPAALSAPGWLEVEAGLLRAGTTGTDLRESLPYTLKLAFTPDWGIRVGGEALVRSSDAPGESRTGYGDTSVVLKRRFAVNDHSAFGLELGGTFSTARAQLGSGSGATDISVNGIYSADLGALHTDLNLTATHLGQITVGESRVQTLVAAALSGNLSTRWSLVGELSGTRQRGADSTAQLLGAASYSPARRITWDGGVAKGLLSGASSWSVFVGGTALVGRVF